MEGGPQRRWLHHIGKAENANCPCDNSTPQTGAHITFDCPTHRAQRTSLLGGRSTWVDAPNEIRVDVNEYEDGVMLFFEYLFAYLT